MIKICKIECYNYDGTAKQNVHSPYKKVLLALFQMLFSATLKKPVHNFQTSTNYFYDIHRMILMQIENQFNEKRKTLLFKSVARIHENPRKDPNAVKYVLGKKIFLWHMGIFAGFEFICIFINVL